MKKVLTIMLCHSLWYYKCSKEVLLGLGIMYAGGGEFTDNIDKMGGKGTAEFISKAIKIYCKKRFYL